MPDSYRQLKFDNKSLYELLKDTIALIQKLVFDFQTVIPKVHVIIDLLDLFQEYFNQISDIIMVT